MNILNLNNLKLKTFTEQNAEDYCLLNNINPLNIIELYLSSNELTDISGIKLFKNLKELYLSNNKLTDISGVNLFKNLERLDISDNHITDIKLYNLTKLKVLDISGNKIKDISFINNLSKLGVLYIINSELESNQIQYINNLKNLKELWCGNGFKDMSVLYKLKKNIKIFK